MAITNKMLVSHAQEFMEKNPLAELDVPSRAVFPTVIAVRKDKMVEEAASRTIGSWVGEKSQGSARSEKESGVVAKSGTLGRIEKDTRSYALIYYNPETKKGEVVEANVSVNFQDETQRAIEEGVGQRSAFEMYEMVSTPIMRQVVDEVRLKAIMDRIKIESPSPFGGGTGVQVLYEAIDPKVRKQYKEEIVALQNSEKRKITLAERLTDHIQMVDAAVAKLEYPNADPKKIIGKLPPLSKVRMFSLYKKHKDMPNEKIMEYVAKDEQFLKAVRERLNAMRVQDIFHVVNEMKNEKTIR